MTYDVNKIQHLVCSACGHEQRCVIAVLGKVEVMPECENCGSTHFASWPRLRMPAPVTQLSSAYMPELPKQVPGRSWP